MKWSLTLCLLVVASLMSNLRGEETWYETKDGVTYQVTRRVEKKPVAETRTEYRTETVYSTEYETEIRETTRNVWVPTTRFVYQPRWHQWWNPFVEPYMTYEPRPVTQWELRTQTVREPVTRRRQIPLAKIVPVQTRELGFVDKPYEERIVVNSAPVDERNAPGVRYAQRERSGTAGSDVTRIGQPATTLQLPIRR